MTPVLPKTSGKPAPIPAEIVHRDGGAPVFSESKEGPRKSFQGTNLLQLLLKNSERSPTHILTHPSGAEDGGEPIPRTSGKAEIFRKNGAAYLQKGDFERALASYRAAYAHAPRDEATLLGLARSEGKAGNPLQALEYYNRLIAGNPVLWVARNERFKLRASLSFYYNYFNTHSREEYEGLISKAGKEGKIIDRYLKVERKRFGELFWDLRERSPQEKLENELDGAAQLALGLDHYLKIESPYIRDTYQRHHEWPRETKIAFIKGNLISSFELLALGNLSTERLADNNFISDRLRRCATETLSQTVQFAKEDSDLAVQGMVPLLEAYHALSEGRGEDARKFFSQVQEGGLISLGLDGNAMGDIAFGESRLLIKLSVVESLLKNGKDWEARKIFEDEIPLGLADAYRYLSPYRDAKTRAIGLLATVAWEEEILGRYRDLSLESAFISGELGPFLSQLAEDEVALVHAVRTRLAGASSPDIRSALEDVKASESGELKNFAAKVLEQVTTKSNSGNSPLVQIFSLASHPWMEPWSAKTWLYFADQAEFFHHQPHFRRLIYSAVNAFALEESERERAGAGLKAITNN